MPEPNYYLAYASGKGRWKGRVGAVEHAVPRDQAEPVAVCGAAAPVPLGRAFRPENILACEKCLRGIRTKERRRGWTGGSFTQGSFPQGSM